MGNVSKAREASAKHVSPPVGGTWIAYLGCPQRRRCLLFNSGSSGKFLQKCSPGRGSGALVYFQLGACDSLLHAAKPACRSSLLVEASSTMACPNIRITSCHSSSEVQGRARWWPLAEGPIGVPVRLFGFAIKLTRLRLEPSLIALNMSEVNQSLRIFERSRLGPAVPLLVNQSHVI